MSTPSRSPSPASEALRTSWCIRLRMRRNVDLPQPDGPISAVTSPACMVSETWSRTRWSPNQAVMSRASSVASGPSSAMTAVGGSDISCWDARSPWSPLLITSAAVAASLAIFLTCGSLSSAAWEWSSAYRRSHHVRQQAGGLVGDGEHEEADGGHGDDPGLPLAPGGPEPAQAKGDEHEQLPPQHDRQPRLRLRGHRVLGRRQELGQHHA